MSDEFLEPFISPCFWPFDFSGGKSEKLLSRDDYDSWSKIFLKNGRLLSSETEGLLSYLV
jgi:hypothetical protein